MSCHQFNIKTGIVFVNQVNYFIAFFKKMPSAIRCYLCTTSFILSMCERHIIHKNLEITFATVYKKNYSALLAYNIIS